MRRTEAEAEAEDEADSQFMSDRAPKGRLLETEPLLTLPHAASADTYAISSTRVSNEMYLKVANGSQLTCLQGVFLLHSKSFL